MKKIFGLLGKNISYSFSKKYFTDKFETDNLDCEYLNFDLPNIESLPEILDQNIQFLRGFNVTVPYKTAVFKYLDEVDSIAEEIGAVNTVKIIDNFYLKGFNTDIYGFENSLKPLLKIHHKKALILGTGGASKAIKYVLKILEIEFLEVSRQPKNKFQISYDELSESILKNYTIIINCTPLGTYPNIEMCPDIPYDYLSKKHLLYDLTYNPSETKFLQEGKVRGVTIKNGLEMLELQAEKAWNIWNS
jgi:shikimate dehydrogenase